MQMSREESGCTFSHGRPRSTSGGFEIVQRIHLFFFVNQQLIALATVLDHLERFNYANYDVTIF